MKPIIDLLKSVRKELNYLFILAVVTVILIDFVLIHIPETFNGGARIGRIIDRVCLSYISAFIFFLVGAHYKSVNDKKTLKPYLNHKLGLVFNQYNDLYTRLEEFGQLEIEGGVPTADELNQILIKLNPNTSGPPNPLIPPSENTWISYLHSVMSETNYAIKDCLLLCHT